MVWMAIFCTFLHLIKIRIISWDTDNKKTHAQSCKKIAKFWLQKNWSKELFPFVVANS